MSEKEKYTQDFEKKLDTFVELLKNYVSTETGEWTVKGFIDVYKNIYTISSDTKIVSKILEIHVFPALLKFADDAGYKIVLAEHQNWYPDLTLVHRKNESIKFALSLRTTSYKNGIAAAFSLPNPKSYSDEKRNSQYPFFHYAGHYCLGTLFTAAEFTDTGLTIKGLNFFVAPLWKIASEKPYRTGNDFVASVRRVKDLKGGQGDFSGLSERVFFEYWLNYGMVGVMIDNKKTNSANLNRFLAFRNQQLQV